jgi:hypothetical protein
MPIGEGRAPTPFQGGPPACGDLAVAEQNEGPDKPDRPGPRSTWTALPRAAFGKEQAMWKAIHVMGVASMLLTGATALAFAQAGGGGAGAGGGGAGGGSTGMSTGGSGAGGSGSGVSGGGSTAGGSSTRMNSNTRGTSGSGAGGETGSGASGSGASTGAGGSTGR